MIASLQGRIASTHSDHLIIVVNGVGYKVFVPEPASFDEASNADSFLHTLLIVREDAMTLYGFHTVDEREVFETLLKVNGVGPRLALAILSSITIDNLRNAVISERAEILTRVPGVGKKTAQKIVFELKDKLTIGLGDAPMVALNDANSEVMDALVSLGYSIVEAQTAIQSLPKNAPDDVEERIRLALQYFI
ncbi:MAG: Holliday junction branch migration protein RuvA [Anaerolineaceae bacterium]|nr:Holliday junction branch migration protein RuvA [Anaerolineaceae bacterium]